MNKEPLVSVIMGVYNTKIEYLRIAMDSILHQTYRNLEFIIIDDASDQWCAAFLEEYITSHPIIEVPPSEWLLELAQKCNNLLNPSQNMVFIMAGYYHSEKFVVTTNTKEPKLNFQTNNDKIQEIFANESSTIILEIHRQERSGQI